MCSYRYTLEGESPSQAAGRRPSSLPDRPRLPASPARHSFFRRRYRLDLERLNFRGRSVYLTDLYHTLVNCPWQAWRVLPRARAGRALPSWVLARLLRARRKHPPSCCTACLRCRYRFYALFIMFYLAMYAVFAAFYASQPGCISKVHNFWHALWFSVTSSATIGEHCGDQAGVGRCLACWCGRKVGRDRPLQPCQAAAGPLAPPGCKPLPAHVQYR